MAGWKVLFVLCFMRVDIVSAAGEPANCGDPPTSQKAVLDDNLNVFPVDTTLTYSCRPGYIWDRSSSRTATCQKDLTWTELKITCNPKSCGSLPDIPYGHIVYSDGVLFGSVATMSCDPGYNIIGRNQRVCLVNGWDHQNPVCEPVMCDNPPEIVDGTFELPSSSGGIKFGDIAIYKCKRFQLIGKNTIHCTALGTWSDSHPVCKDVKCPDPQVVNGKKTNHFVLTYRYQESVTFECILGYQMNGSSTITCQKDNTWDPKPPTCERDAGDEGNKEGAGNAGNEDNKNEGAGNAGNEDNKNEGAGNAGNKDNKNEDTDTSKHETNTVVAAVCGSVAGVFLVVGAVAGYLYSKKKNGGSYETTEEKMCPASSVNTSSQQYSALQNKDTNV